MKAGLLALSAVLLTVALLVGLRLARPGVLPGLVVAGAEVGGLDRAALTQRLDELEERHAAERVAVTRPEQGDLESATVVRTAGAVGYRLDVEATADRVLVRGRQANPVTALADHLRAFRGRTRIDPVELVDDDRLATAVEDIAGTLQADPVEGAVLFVRGEVRRTDPRPGARVEQELLATRLRTAVLSRGDAEVDAPVELVATETTIADVEAAAADAEVAMSAPVALVRGEMTIALGPAEHLSDILSVQRSGTDVDRRRLELIADSEALAVAVPDGVEDALATDPVDAAIAIVDGGVSIRPSADGFRFDPVIAAEQVEQLVLQRDPAARTTELDGTFIEPERTTADVEALGITEKVSEFTTFHACCQNRVTNIQQMARTVDGVIIEPGETFSLNGFVGPRTRAKGYVPGGAILDGEYIEDVGGGVSQFTTTMYNAAFFGGYAIPEHKPHSYYISRYPVGREATLDYPSVDLKITNNSPHGIFVDTSFSPTSITVAFWGTKWVHVAEHTGPRHNLREPETQYRINPDLPPGQTRQVQAPSPGFDIVVTRTLTFPDGHTDEERIFTRYLPQPRIIERAPPPPEPPPADEPQDTEESPAAGDAVDAVDAADAGAAAAADSPEQQPQPAQPAGSG